ncbi:hypothetical protein ACH4U7_50980 [Streptomyces sp. NPDC020845]|uniref:hypothetical protein n=1 Tax=Streptomyces sp. NPDC020845 TaxID=3365096 RepID=UPI0037912E84
MAHLTFDDLYHVSLASLGSAADDWKEMVDQLETLATDARDGMVKQSEAARWAGVNADVTRPFVRKTGKEFGDAHAEAKAIWAMLRDAHKELAALQSALKQAVDVDAKHKFIQVTGLSDGTVSCVYLHRRDTNDVQTQAQLDYKDRLESRINKLIAQADDIDKSTAHALKTIHGGNSHDFGHAKYDSLDDAQSARAVQLARKSLAKYRDGGELSITELAELKRIFAQNSKDREFAVDFYKALGPKNALRFQAQIALDASAEGDKTQFKLAHSIQTSMGEALATATRPPTGKDDPNTAFREDRDYLGKAWQTELKRVGRERLPLSMNDARIEPRGYQVLSTLLRHGSYDKEFLTSVAEDMVTFERKHPRSWGWADNAYTGDGMDKFGLNLDKEGGPGWDPMTGLLEGLAHNPDASTEFFSGSTGEGEHDGLKKLSNLDYFLGDKHGENARQWLPDATGGTGSPDAEDKIFGKEALGHALESATSGNPYGSDAPSKHHTQAEADVFHSIVKKVAANPELFKGDGEFAPIVGSLGNMSAEYMHDIQRVYAGGDDSGFIRHTGAEPDFRKERGKLDLFLETTAEDPKAYSTITHAQQAVTTEMFREVVAQSGDSKDLKGVAAIAAEAGARLEGVTAEGRANAIAAADNSLEKIDEYNESLEKGDAWLGRFVDLGMSTLDNIPVAGEVAGWVIEDFREAILNHKVESSDDAVEQIERHRKEFLDNEHDRIGQASKKAFLLAAKDAGLSMKSDNIKNAADSVYNGAYDANSGENS